MSKRDDEELLGFVSTGLRAITSGIEKVLQGDQRFWAYDDHYFRRRRPKGEVPSAAPPEIVAPLIERIDRAASEHAMAYEALLTTQEVADFLGLERISVGHLVSSRHVEGIRIGNRSTIRLGELRRYLEEGPAHGMIARTDWRPLVEEFPGRRQQAEREARTEVLRQKYDAITVQDLRALFD